MPPIGGTCRKSRDRSEAMMPSGSVPREVPPVAAPDGEGPGDADAAALAAEGAAEVADEALAAEAEEATADAAEGAAEADGVRGLPFASTLPALIAAISTSMLASTRSAGTRTARLRRSCGRAARSSRTWA